MRENSEATRFRVVVSARHLHLTQDMLDILFGTGHVLTPVGAEGESGPAIPKSGQFLSTTRATVIGPKAEFRRVAVMGPCRKFNQFELSMTDARTLGLDAPVRMSGDIDGTPGIKVVGTVGEIVLENGVIVAKRHIHLNPLLAAEHGVEDGDTVLMRIETDSRSLIFDDTIARVSKNPNVRTVSHIDTDEGNAAGISREAPGYIVGKSE